MSSSAFFIEAAAKTVTALSCAAAGEWAAPNRMTKAEKIPAKRYMSALRACLQRGFHAQIRRWLGQECDRRKRCSAIPIGLRPVGISHRKHNRLAGRVKVTVCLPEAYSAGRIAIEIESSLVPLTCTKNGAAESSNLTVLRMPSQSVAPLKALGF